jgi:hypothetical protein
MWGRAKEGEAGKIARNWFNSVIYGMPPYSVVGDKG